MEGVVFLKGPQWVYGCRKTAQASWALNLGARKDRLLHPIWVGLRWNATLFRVTE